MSKSTKKWALGTLLAAAAGFLAGLLTAPQSGEETRRDIKDAAVKAKTEAEKNLQKVHGELDELTKQGKIKAAHLKTKAKDDLTIAVDTAKMAKDKAGEVLGSIRKGQVDDKDLQKALKEGGKALAHLKTFLVKDAKNKKV